MRSSNILKRKVEENGIPNHSSKIPADEVKFGSGTGWFGSQIA